MSFKLTYLDVYTAISEYMGCTLTGTDLVKVKNIVKRGYRRFLMPIDERGKSYGWKFLERTATLSVVANKDTYDLPDGFNGFVGTLQYTTPALIHPVERDLDFILRKKAEMGGTSYPLYYAWKTGNFDKVNGQKDQIVFYPTPNAALEFYYTYMFTPPEPTDDGDMFVGDEMAAEAILEQCLAVAEATKYDTPGERNPGVHATEAQRVLQMCIGADKGKRLIGNMGQITNGTKTLYTRYSNIYQNGTQIVP